MSIPGIIAAVVLLALSLLWLALPLLRNKQTPALDPEIAKQQEALLTTYERTLLAVRDLDEDYQVGKLNDDAYQAARAALTEQGAATLEALETLTGKPHRKAVKPAPAAAKPSVKPTSAKSASVKPAAPAPAAEDDPVEAAIAAYMAAQENRAQREQHGAN